VVNNLLHKVHTILFLIFQGTFFKVLIRKKSQRKYAKAKATNKTSINIIYNGIKLNLYTDSKLSDILMFKQFEFEEQSFVKYYLKKGGIFVDIGSNIGLFSLIASKIVGKNGRVYSFEPTPETFIRFKQNIKLNNIRNICPYNLAVSNKSGMRDFLVSHDGYDAWNSFGKPSAGEEIEKIKVNTITFDEFMNQNNIGKIDLIKIDVEGWELNVLNGGQNYFNKSNSAAILIEFGDINLQNAGFKSKDLYDLLLKFGYYMYRYDYHNRLLIKDNLRKEYPYCNLIALKESHLVGLKVVN